MTNPTTTCSIMHSKRPSTTLESTKEKKDIRVKSANTTKARIKKHIKIHSIGGGGN